MDRRVRKTTLNDRLEFLIILHVHDLERSCFCKSLKQKIAKYADGLNGKLHIGIMNKDTCTCCAIPYQVQGVINAHEVYVKLPKENIYVRGMYWEHEYMKSKVQELLYIFRKLRARELELAVEQCDTNSRHISGDAGVSLSEYGIDVDVDVGIRVEDFKESSDCIRAKIVFASDSDTSSSSSSSSSEEGGDAIPSKEEKPSPPTTTYLADDDRSAIESESQPSSTPPSSGSGTSDEHRLIGCNTSICGTNTVYRFMTDVLTDSRIHYVRQFPDWIGFIRERLVGKAKHIRFTFTHYNVLVIEREVRARLQHLGISFHLKEKERGWTKMLFKACF
jgi:hypothetical protein